MRAERNIEAMCRQRMKRNKARIRAEHRHNVYVGLLTTILVSWAAIIIMAVQLVRVSKAADSPAEAVLGETQPIGQTEEENALESPTEGAAGHVGIVHLAGIDTDLIWGLPEDFTPDDLATSQETRQNDCRVLESLGEFKITYYCCERRPHICGTGDGITATGVPVKPGIVAVDPDVIPLGSTVVIDGVEYLAADVGGRIRGNRIDIAVETHKEALRLGVRQAEVYIIGEEACRSID